MQPDATVVRRHSVWQRVIQALCIPAACSIPATQCDVAAIADQACLVQHDGAAVRGVCIGRKQNRTTIR